MSASPDCGGQGSGLAGLHYHDRTCMRERTDGSVYCVKEEDKLASADLGLDSSREFVTAIATMSQYWPGFSGELRMVIDAAYTKGVAAGQQFERNRVAVERDALSSHWSSR